MVSRVSDYVRSRISFYEKRLATLDNDHDRLFKSHIVDHYTALKKELENVLEVLG